MGPSAPVLVLGQEPVAEPADDVHLRTALLTQAEATVRERGGSALSLRELAREVGVSHGAPRRHFPDPQALLDALAEAGFERLGTELRTAGDSAGDDFPARPGPPRRPTSASPPTMQRCSS